MYEPLQARVSQFYMITSTKFQTVSCVMTFFMYSSKYACKHFFSNEFLVTE